MARPGGRRRRRVCVLVSGGLDSAALILELSRGGAEVHPLYVRCGFRWERAELHWLRRLLSRLRRPGLFPLTVSGASVARPPGHWAVTGRGVPVAGESVYLPARNIVLLAAGAALAASRGLDAIALAVLKGNPFPDGSPRFMRLMGRALTAGLGRPVEVLAPYRRLSKAQVARRAARELPRELLFSCLNPRGLRPCGRCDKCAEAAALPR